MERVDLILTDIKIILTMDENFNEFKDGDIVIKDGKIHDIGTNLRNKYYGKTLVCKDKIALPGLINTHTHGAMTLLRGLGSDNPLNVWLEKYIWPIEGKFVSYDFVKEGIKIAVYEMLRNGITTFVDMYFYENAVADVLNEIGMRGVLSTGILDFPTPGAKNADEGIQKTINFIKEYSSDYVIPAIGPHAPYTCSPETLKKCMDVAEKYGILYHIHLSETENEVKTVKEKFGKTPIEHLESIGILNQLVLAAHVVHPTEKEIELLKKRDVKVSHCPESNLKLASGVSPVPEMLKEGIVVSIGTDGTASNDDLDIIGEISTAAKLHKGVKMDPTVLNSKEALVMATRNGAKGVNMYDKIGSLEVGKSADITLIDASEPHLNPLYDPYTQIVYSGKGSDVDTVIINGEIKVLNKDVLPISREEVLDIAEFWKNRIENN